MHVSPGAGRCLDGIYGHEALPYAALSQHAHGKRRAAAQTEIEMQVAHTVYGYLGEHQAAHGVALTAVGDALLTGHGDDEGFQTVGCAVVATVEPVGRIRHKTVDDMCRASDMQHGTVPGSSVRRGIVYIVIGVAVGEEHAAGRHNGYCGCKAACHRQIIDPYVHALCGGLCHEGYIVGADEACQWQTQYLPSSTGVNHQSIMGRESVGVGGHRHLTNYKTCTIVVAGAHSHC